ncbi:hypothetical protein DM02DRAFT_178377 [Periconia macrospinosa]|uniref:Uncharacterized protein n=1 Tax=Periconia macrospinosa TaxID=97972 RepID=A0A2V1E1L5_9PLEO|nr:hypothetical protein DM02DRAFT_178377 [Periconia macrospinosa]
MSEMCLRGLAARCAAPMNLTAGISLPILSEGNLPLQAPNPHAKPGEAYHEPSCPRLILSHKDGEYHFAGLEKEGGSASQARQLGSRCCSPIHAEHGAVCASTWCGCKTQFLLKSSILHWFFPPARNQMEVLAPRFLASRTAELFYRDLDPARRYRITIHRFLWDGMLNCGFRAVEVSTSSFATVLKLWFSAICEWVVNPTRRQNSLNLERGPLGGPTVCGMLGLIVLCLKWGGRST